MVILTPKADDCGWNRVFEGTDGKEYRRESMRLVDLIRRIKFLNEEYPDRKYDFLTAAQTREVINDNDFRFGLENTVTCNGADYANLDHATLFITPRSRILSARPDAFDQNGMLSGLGSGYAISRSKVASLRAEAQNESSGIITVDLDALSKSRWYSRGNGEHGHVAVSTTDYEQQMAEDPNVSAVITAGFGSGDALHRTMKDLRCHLGRKGEYQALPDRISTTHARILTPEFVRARIRKNTGVGYLAMILKYANSMWTDSLDGDIAFDHGSTYFQDPIFFVYDSLRKPFEHEWISTN